MGFGIYVTSDPGWILVSVFLWGVRVCKGVVGFSLNPAVLGTFDYRVDLDTWVW